VDSAVRTPAVVPDPAVDSSGLQRQGAQPTGHQRCGHRPAVRTASPDWPPFRKAPRTAWQGRQAAAGVHCRRRRVCLDGRRPAARGVPRPWLIGAAAVSAVDGGVRTATVPTLGQWTRLVDIGSRRRPPLRTPVTAAASRRPCGNATLDGRQDNRPPPPRCPTGTRPQGAAAASTRGLTATSVVWCLASIWSAPDGSGLLRWDGPSVESGSDGSSRIVWMIHCHPNDT
jgi:hypothetical protein